jgi:kinesin family protein 3/17
LVRASYLQIYNESISDLLKADRTGLQVREDKARGLYVEGLSEWVVSSTAEVGKLLARGQSARATGSTRLNEISSRSHAVVLVTVELSGAPSEPVRVGKLNLVDLAGSERLSAVDSSATRLQESKKINTSLSALGNVVAALSERAAGRSRAHIPYRDSKLTRLLEDSLGGNCKTTLIALVSPTARAFAESLSTLKFATRAKTVRNQPTVNLESEVDQGALLREYAAQLASLRQELATRSKSLGDSARLLELEQMHRRAEEDRLEAMRALEQRTSEYLGEKAHKRALEARIVAFESQLLGRFPTPGGGDGSQLSLELQYSLRLEELEREKAAIEEDKAQVTRYKALLVKQRDLMLALTRRLTERDGSLNDLQAELDRADARAQALEDELDARTLELLTVQRVALEHGVPQDALAVSPAQTQRLLARYGPRGGGLDSIAEQPAAAPAASDALSLAAFDAPRPFDAAEAKPLPATSPLRLRAPPPLPAALSPSRSTDGAGALHAALRAADKRLSQLEHDLADAQDALAANDVTIDERVQQLVDAEVGHVAADAVEVVAQAKASRAEAEGLRAEAEALRAELDAVAARCAAAEAARGARDAELAAAERELACALADARGALGALARADGVSDAARDVARDASEASVVDDEAEAQSLDGRLRALRLAFSATVQVAHDTAARAPPPGEAAAATESQQVARLKYRCAAHVKERAALTSILDKKVKVLVDELSRSLAAATAPSAPPHGDAMQSALKQVGVLQKLVHAAVAALKMPDSTDGDEDEAD